MKKWLCALSMCAITGLGVVGFAGCGGEDEVASIHIKSVPVTDFVVGDVVTPTLKDGTFTIKYNSGRSNDLPLSMADLVYVDNSDGTTSNEFTYPNRAQIVVVQYKNKTTTFNVSVSSKEIATEYTKQYSTVYNGSQQRADLQFNLPNGVDIAKVEYRLIGAPEGSLESLFTDTAPTNAGVYNVRVYLDGGNNYISRVIDDVIFTIAPAQVTAFQTQKVSFNNIVSQYGDTLDVSKNWTMGTSIEGVSFAETIKSDFSFIANKIQYRYAVVSNTATEPEFVPLTLTEAGYDISDLEPGTYKLQATCMGLENFEAFTYECELNITPRVLVYGEDFAFKITTKEGSVTYISTQTPMNIDTKIRTSDPTQISITVEYLNDKYYPSTATAITYNYSESGLANWGGEGITKIEKYGDYKITINTEFYNDYCSFSNEFFGVSVVSN